MALTESEKLNYDGPLSFVKGTVNEDKTFYQNDWIMEGGDDGYYKVLSSSNVAGNQFVGVVPYEQELKAGELLTVADSRKGALFAVSASGDLAKNELVYASDESGVTAAKSDGQLPVGRWQFASTFAKDGIYGKNCFVELGTAASGSTE